MAAANQVGRALGERLRLARTAAGLTQEQAATQVGVARTTMVALERGDRQPRPEELTALAKLYGTSASALLRQSSLHVDLVGQFRRALKPETDTEEELAALRLLQKLVASTVELEQRLGRPLVTDYPPEVPLRRGRLAQQAEDLAMEVRSRLGLGVRPIRDVVALVELELGVRVFVRPLAGNISGVFGYAPEAGACILLNRNHPRVRRNWSAAHELGHFLTSRTTPSVDYDHQAASPTERFADLFAAAFLMPGSAIRRAFDEFVAADQRFSPRHLILLAHRFDVSLEAMGRRLEQLALLKQGTYDSLKERGLGLSVARQVLGIDREERDADVPPRVALLAAEAYELDLISEQQLAELLALDLVEARKLLDALAADFHGPDQ